MKWTSKTLGADLNESKLNARVDNPDNLFEIIPKVLIQIEDDMKSHLREGKKIFAVTAGGIEDPVGIALGSQLLILNKNRDDVERTLDFPASIDVIIWRRSVFIVGLSNSEIILLCPITFQQKESKRVSPNPAKLFQDQFFVDAFIHSNPDTTKIDLLALGVDGAVYSFQNVSLVEGSAMDNTLDENMTIEIDLATIKGTVRRYLGDSANVLSAASPARNFIVTGEENGKLSMIKLWENESPENDFEQFFRDIDLTEYLGLPDDAKIKKIVRCEGLLFVLFTNGHLEILLDDELFPTGGLILPKSNCIVQDFTMVLYSTDEVKLWAIFSNPEEDENYIGIFPGPSFSAEFIVKIPILSESAAEENTIYSFPRQTNPYDEPTAVITVESCGWTTLYHMSESSTDISLQNLLAKSRFKKAELLAKKYGKDLDLVWKTKVKAKFNEVISGQNEKLIEKSFEELVSTLQLVQDAEFVCMFCIKEKGIPRLGWVKELLTLGLKRAKECSRSEAGHTLLLTWKKLYTFDQVVANAEIGQWSQFNDIDNTMYSQCLWFLELNEFKKCEIVWLRHSDEFIPNVDLQHFASFFKKLFEKCLSSPDSISLFKTILPCALEKCESETELDGNQIKINAFVALIRRQIRSLERENEWPNEAIVFTKVLIKIIEEEYKSLEEEKINTGEIRIEKKLKICSDILTKLKKLFQALSELLDLKTSHSIRIGFEKYITGSESEVVNSMLKLLFAKEEVERFVKKFLRPYASRNNLNMDTLFKDHIQSASEDVQYFINSGAIPFEERLVSLVGFIEEPKIKLACVFRMTEEWPVPWLPLMKGVVTRCLEMNVSNDEECRELQKTIKLMEIQVPYRCLLHKYRFTASKLSKGFGVYLALKRILKWKKKDWWADCIELIKHTGKYTSDSVCAIKFWLELSSTTTSLDDIIPEEYSVALKLRFLRRVLYKFKVGLRQSEEPDEMWKRFTECAKILANGTDDDKTVEFLKLRQSAPNLLDDIIISSVDYPFSALELLVPQLNGWSSAQIIVECNKLSDLSFSNASDILLIIAFLLSGPANLGSAYQKIWDILTLIVETPNGFSGKKDTDIVPNAGIEVAHHLILFTPTMSSQCLTILFNFCVLLEESYEEAAEKVAKLQTVIYIFQALREAEIPLEHEFLLIYKEIWRDGLKVNEELISKLEAIGQIILRFGNTDLLRQIFNGIEHELIHQSMNLFGERKQKYIVASSSVYTLKEKLLNESEAFELPETNIRVKNLVKALDEAGVKMNSYALRERNKEKLIKKLIKMNLFHLAAQTALVFDFREQMSWSNILQEYMYKASIIELKTLLESLKKITDLWVIPEFSEAWLKVSKEFPNFKNICPIPLDF